MRLGVLVSGRGSNLEAVLEARATGRLPGIDPVLVISNRVRVRALEVAAQHGVRSVVLNRSGFPDAGSRDRAIGQALVDARCDLALLAGYDQVLRPAYFEAYGGPTINIHPSLLPRHGGRGMVGLAVHAAVLAAGDVETGVTIHRVTIELDAGPPLAQARIPVRAGDDAEALARRVLAVEHRLLVATLSDIGRRGLPHGEPVSMTGAPSVTSVSGEEAKGP